MAKKCFPDTKQVDFLMTASNILEDTISTLTATKLEMLFLLSVPLSTGETAAIVTVSGKIPMVKLSL